MSVHVAMGQDVDGLALVYELAEDHRRDALVRYRDTLDQQAQRQAQLAEALGLEQ